MFHRDCYDIEIIMRLIIIAAFEVDSTYTSA